MDDTAVRDKKAKQAAEEVRLTRAAASGDGGAFAELYRRYEECAYNLAYRIVGSEADAVDAVEEAFPIVMRRPPGDADGDARFGLELLAAVRHVCDDLLDERRVARQSEAAPESAPEEVRDASLRLPARQREALALAGLAPLSYDEIAAIMEMNGSTVAQLISRARINLYDELRGTVLASVAPPSPECERALPSIAAREDGQLEASSAEAAWLDGHLAACGRCRLAVEQMEEARTSYSAWAPIAAVPWLLGETMARVAELIGVDWSEEITEAATRTQAGPSATAPVRSPKLRWGRLRGRRLTFAAGAGLLLLLFLALATALLGGGGSPSPVESVAGAASEQRSPAREPGAKTAKSRRGRGAAAKKSEGTKAKEPTSPAQPATLETPAPGSVPAQAPTDGVAPTEPAAGDDANRSPGKTAVQPTHQTAATKPSPSSEPAPASTTASQPATEPTPAPPSTPPAESSPATEEEPDSPGRSGEAPGKPANRPAH